MTVQRVGQRIIEFQIVNDQYASKVHAIPRIKLISADKRLPSKLSRIQFPVVPAFAMTINKSQGQTLERVGLYLMKQVFSHGQLYVGMSRVRRSAIYEF